MSEAPKDIYIAASLGPHETPTYSESRLYDSDIGYVLGTIAYRYACEVERLRARVVYLESKLREISNSHHLPEHGLKCMARDALTKEG